MKDNNQLLHAINETLHKLHKVTCCKLDDVILASGGTPTLYNNWSSSVVDPGNSYTTPEAHSITVSVIGGASDVANVIVGGISQTWPIGYSVSVEATTVFGAGHLEIEASSTATVIVGTITE